MLFYDVLWKWIQSYFPGSRLFFFRKQYELLSLPPVGGKRLTQKLKRSVRVKRLRFSSRFVATIQGADNDVGFWNWNESHLASGHLAIQLPGEGLRTSRDGPRTDECDPSIVAPVPRSARDPTLVLSKLRSLRTSEQALLRNYQSKKKKKKSFTYREQNVTKK